MRRLALPVLLATATARPTLVRSEWKGASSPEADGDDGKVNLVLDQLAYRSASQGPVMPAELEPASKDDYDEIDSVIERACRTHGWAPVIPQYKRSMQWAWQQWEYTIAERLWKSACYNMLVPLLLLLATHWAHPGMAWWYLPKTHSLYEPFVAISHGWNYLLTLATFVTTFFVGHSHDFWRKSYSLTRSVQGRLNDIGLLCATHACRQDGQLTDEATQFLEDTARNLRLMHCLFYADVCYRKVGTTQPQASSMGSIRMLLSFDRVARTAPGLVRLRDRGMITDREYDTLVSLGLPPARWYLVVLEWVVARIASATRKGILVGGSGFEKQVLEKCCDLRAACMTIPDELAARMPLAYVHFTHCLVDILLLIAPFGLFANLGCFSIPMTGLFALFYRGLLELSKSFLDPFGNRRVSISGLSADINIDCLIGETNAGSLVWPQGAKLVPFD
ncbi:hypothetical protein AB1Y20_000449 [Prymnesium parvum]|uniref:Bestrophin homolog n=1 Tax=Prymnesium parvum TaxID=97485 RepID=A0AB34K4R3_PRYPA|mmetsp:Transcript_8414/g.18568  ORF Transcript_8414/g.18568 Transcript_8414/m.18568 type:complete len:449 (-) Transcript_8414:350-1696(-)